MPAVLQHLKSPLEKGNNLLALGFFLKKNPVS